MRSGRESPHGIDRMLRNVETGPFDHDSASSGNKMMWRPVALGPTPVRQAWA
jgi:hypothetical protein